MAPETIPAPGPNGPVAAALMASGLGCAALGVMTSLAGVSPEVAEALDWWPPAGPLTGKAGVATGTFFTSWLALHLAWRRRDVAFAPVAAASALLLAVGLVGTFPPFFQRLAPREH